MPVIMIMINVTMMMMMMMMMIAVINWVRRICKVTQEDRMKIKELREEIVTKNTSR